MPSGQEKFIAIADIQGWGYSNSDIRGYIAALSVLQVNVAIVLNRLLLDLTELAPFWPPV